MTANELAERLTAAREKEKRARAEAAKLKRALVEADRRRRSSQLIALGAALIRAADANPGAVESLRRLVLPHIIRDSDKAALTGTAFGELTA